MELGVQVMAEPDRMAEQSSGLIRSTLPSNNFPLTASTCMRTGISFSFSIAAAMARPKTSPPPPGWRGAFRHPKGRSAPALPA